MPFMNREEAANRLAKRLEGYKGKNPLILAIPRGAVPMASIIAEHIGGEIDVVLVHKLGAPGNPEYAVGSVDEYGHIYLGEGAKLLGLTKEYLDNEVKRQFSMLKERRGFYTEVREAISPSGRIVIIVDDGIATGSTMIAAIRGVKESNPKKVIVAVAVAPPETIEKIKNIADEVICLETPKFFGAVGAFFEDFRQVNDKEVIGLLRKRS